MQKWMLSLWLLLSLLASSVTCHAQYSSKLSVFGGYNFVRAYSTNQLEGFNLHGLNASVEVKPLKNVAFVADLSEEWGSPRGQRVRQTTVMFGPRYIFTGTPRVTPYVHVLAGFARAPNGFSYCPAVVPGCPGTTTTDNVLAMAAGGGMDVKLKGRIWWRAVEVDWLHANFPYDHRARARLATGIVIRFGR